RLISPLYLLSLRALKSPLFPYTTLFRSKDQFTETCRMIRIVNPVLLRRRRRVMRIGALFVSTPNSAEQVLEEEWSNRCVPAGGEIGRASCRERYRELEVKSACKIESISS